MAEIKWIKLSTQMFEDEKIRLIEGMPEADTILVVWVKLLSLAGKTNTRGFIFLNENIPYSDEMLATLFNRPLNIVRMSLDILRKFGMIEIDQADRIYISNWEKHQSVDEMEKIREQTRLRVQKHRDTLKLQEPKSDSNVTCNVTVTGGNGTEEELELELDKENSKEQSKKPKAVIQQAERFDEWWNLYANKQGRAKCVPKYNSLLKKVSEEQIIEGTRKYHEYRIALKKAGKHVPDMKHPSTFLNGEHYNDEFEELIAGIRNTGKTVNNQPASFRELAAAQGGN